MDLGSCLGDFGETESLDDEPPENIGQVADIRPPRWPSGTLDGM
jgi:hypothetical protein